MIDPLTHFPNIFGLLDWAGQAEEAPCSLMVVRLDALWQVNRIEGRSAGDRLLRAYADGLRALAGGPVFRAGGDKFVVVLRGGDFSHNLERARQIAEQCDPRRTHSGLRPSAVALVHYASPQEVTPSGVMAGFFFALSMAQAGTSQWEPREYRAAELVRAPEYAQIQAGLALQLMRLFEESAPASLDVVSGLPNQQVAAREAEASLRLAAERGETMAFLLVDGDGLRQYNAVAYEAGDEVIRLLGKVLREQLRETDFVARFRCGDEFLVLLRNTGLEQARSIAARLCLAVERCGQGWLFPTTISVGIAMYPYHGNALHELLDEAERSLKQAKQNGRNQAVIHLN